MTFSLFADTTKQLPDTGKLNMNMVYKDAKEALKGLGEALKVGSEHVYVVLVRQQMVNSISGIIIILILFIIATRCFVWSKNSYEAHLKLGESDSYWCIDDSAKGIASIAIAIFGGVLGIIFIVMFCSNYNDIITGFINPEYGALRDIMHFIKK
jgi:hypothetical protein